MDLTLQLRPAQTVTPQMIASMTILQYGTQELTEYLSELSYENPMLDLQESEDRTDHITDRLRWLQPGDWHHRKNPVDTSVLVYAAGDQTLEAFLREQLLPLSIRPELRHAAEVLIALLDEHGFFHGNFSEAARLARCSENTVRQALSLLQQMEPTGVATSDVKECLMAQLHRLGHKAKLARRILASSYLCSYSPDRLAAELHESTEAVEAALAQIASLSPYPASGFSTQESTVYIQPDLYILWDRNQLTVRCSDNTTPRVHINRQYLSMLETEHDPAVQKYLREKLRQVEQVIQDLQHRKSTILRCGEILAHRQQRFFRGGSLSKLTLRDVAQELSLHESTVSRTAKDKYLQCDRGLFPMRYFFSRSAGQNPNLCRTNIQDTLAKIIAEEDPQHPFSDEQLSKHLAAQHIVISRRTVAKYRSELGIPTTAVRRQIVVS